MNEPKIAKTQPSGITLESGKNYAWCSCGLSENQPFCDGKHKGTGFTPHVFKADADKEVWFCNCKHTKDQPFCDGSHNALS